MLQQARDERGREKLIELLAVEYEPIVFSAVSELGIIQQSLARTGHPLFDSLKGEGVGQKIDVLTISFAINCASILQNYR